MALRANVAVRQLGRTRRKLRYPQHQFILKQIPFTIQPFMIAPVIPGESLAGFQMQSRCVTDPIKNGITGWWLEHYYFYVKHQDLDERATLMGAMIDPSTTIASLKNTTDNIPHYFNPGAATQLDWVKMCLKRVTEEYFRTEKEAWDVVTINGLPLASVQGNSWLDSFINDDEFQTSIEPTIDTSGASVGISVIEQAMRQWELLKEDNLMDWTYEDFLRSYGVSVEREIPYKPELIRYTRNWQYPSNTVDPATGAPSSAVSWAVQERGDKAHFFKEPGFIFGVSVIRPKIFFSGQKTAGVSMLDNPFTWLPAVFADDPATSLKEFAAGANGGILPGNTDDYWVDVKDLFMFGDQYINVDPTTGGINSLALPTAAGVWKYPTNQAMLDTLFVSANATCRQDGVVRMMIKSHLENTS